MSSQWMTRAGVNQTKQWRRSDRRIRKMSHSEQQKMLQMKLPSFSSIKTRRKWKNAAHSFNNNSLACSPPLPSAPLPGSCRCFLHAMADWCLEIQCNWVWEESLSWATAPCLSHLIFVTQKEVPVAESVTFGTRKTHTILSSVLRKRTCSPIKTTQRSSWDRKSYLCVDTL